MFVMRYRIRYAQPSGRNAAATVAVVYCGPDPSIGLLFRKFGKKDSLTRMKAYEELRGRVEDSDGRLPRLKHCSLGHQMPTPAHW